jgi:predicted TPR repeat methyltransferase
LRGDGRYADAIECYHRVLRIRPDYAEGHNNLGICLSELGKLDEGMACYQRALQIKPDYAEAHRNAGTVLQSRGNLDQAAKGYQRALDLNPRLMQVYERLGSVLLKQGHIAAAAAVWEQWIRLEPDEPVARHMLAAATGRDVPARASDGYLRSHFDAFAPTFDQQLERLAYCGPQLVAAAAANALGQPMANLDVLDAGCGTGTGGPLLRPYARRLTGVDLSKGMLELARARGVYDDLILLELTAHLRECPERYDVIAAADTLIYFGDLLPLLSASAGALRPGGRLIVTAEQAADRHPHTGGFKLQYHGRYCHTVDYLRETMADAGLTVREITTAILRKELGHPVPGVTVTCAK